MEVVVALAILGIGIAALVELYSLSLRSAKKSSDYSTALIYARSSMDEAYSSPKLEPRNETFDLPKGFRLVREIKLVSTSKEAGQDKELAVYEISVSVTWPPSGRTALSGLRVLYEEK